MRTRLLAALLLGAVAVGTAWAFLAPPALGGQTSYVITRGESMLPAFHTGDLALVRTAGLYRTGDVIAYRSPTLDTVVLHRVVEANPDGLITRGDHNDWTDPDQVAPQQVIGRLWLQVPKVGAALGPARAALPFLLIVLVVGAAGSTGAFRRRRSRSRSRRGTPDAPGSVSPARPASRADRWPPPRRRRRTAAVQRSGTVSTGPVGRFAIPQHRADLLRRG